MMDDQRTVAAHDRVVEALAEEISRAGDGEVVGAYAGRGARVEADSLRQRVRRIALARSTGTDDGRHRPHRPDRVQDRAGDKP